MTRCSRRCWRTVNNVPAARGGPAQLDASVVLKGVIESSPDNARAAMRQRPP